METYVIIGSFTRQGSRLGKDGAPHISDLKQKLSDVGGELRDVYYTLGQYDLIAIVALPNDKAMAKFSLSLGTQGNLRTLTLRAFPREQLNALLNTP